MAEIFFFFFEYFFYFFIFIFLNIEIFIKVTKITIQQLKTQGLIQHGRDIWYSVWDKERAIMGRALAIDTRKKNQVLVSLRVCVT